MKTSEEKLYYNRLKNDIDSFVFKFKRQYRAFPIREITKLSKIRFKATDKIKIQGYTYTVKESIRRLRKSYRTLKSATRPGYFSYILSGYNKDVRSKKTSTQKKEVYQKYKRDLDTEISNIREELWACLSIVKELNRMSNDKMKNLGKELEDPVEESAYIMEVTRDDIKSKYLEKK